MSCLRQQCCCQSRYPVGPRGIQNLLHCRSTALHEKPLDEEQKQDLLASLNALDAAADEEQQVKKADATASSLSSSYEPSFSQDQAASSSLSPCRKHEESVFGFDPTNNNPFNSTSFKSLDSSINSVKSSISIDSEKKAKLMRELFSSK